MISLADALVRYRDKILATDDAGQSLTYGEVMARGLPLLAGLSRPKAFVVLLVSNTVPSLAAYLAAVASGHAVLMLDRSVAPDLLAEIERLYRPDLVVAPDEPATAKAGAGPLPELHPDLSVLLSTSGSTGSPKLARYSWGQAEANARAIIDYLGIADADVPFLMLPMHYSFGYSIVNSHVLAGATLALTNHTMMQREFWQRLEASGATSLSGVPFHFEMLHRLGPKRVNFAGLKTLTQAGGKLSPELVTAFTTLAEEKGLSFVVMYGQTEAGPRISYLPPAMARGNPASIGIPIPGVALDLLGEDGQPVLDGTEGELVCRSPAIMMGYAEGAADLSLGDVMGGRLATGDLARRNGDGSYAITGRKSRFLKLQGNRVNLDDVEGLAKRLGYTAACVGRDNWLCVAIEAGADAAALKQAIITAYTFPPRAVEVKSVAAIPRSESGKVRYKALLDLVSEGGAA